MISIPDKSTIRNTMLARRQALSDAVRADVAQAIIPTLLAAIPQGSLVAGYRAIKGEVDILPAMLALAGRGSALCLPVAEERLAFLRWNPEQPLVYGRYGIQIPEGGEAVIPDIVLVPLVAFDDSGHRIGYGAGYYDEAIRRLRQGAKPVTFIGIAYDFQRVEHLPAEAHDERLDRVITIT